MPAEPGTPAVEPTWFVDDEDYVLCYSHATYIGVSRRLTRAAIRALPRWAGQAAWPPCRYCDQRGVPPINGPRAVREAIEAAAQRARRAR